MSILTISPSDKIQKALNNFDPKQKSVLRLLPGVYEEDLELPSDIVIEGSGVADLDFTVIRGNHTFPTSGSIGFNHVKFESDTNIFESKAEANFIFLYRSCVLQVKDGYPLFIPDAKGNGIFFDCCMFGRDNGFVNNVNGSSSIRFYNLTSKSENPNSELILNNSSLFFNVHINHKIRLLGNNSKYDFQGGCWIENEILAGDNVEVNIGTSQIDKVVKKQHYFKSNGS